MNTDRRKSIMALGVTLLIGILLGLLVPGFVHKMQNREERRGRGPYQNPNHKKEWFVGTINRILKPDSAQAKQIKPITDWASIQMDSIEHSANHQMSTLLDSVKSQLNPILSEAQRSRLEEFNMKAKSHWNPGERHRRK